MDDLISRRAAIDATWRETGYTDPINVATAIRNRIEALSSAEVRTQMSSATDCISRQAAIDLVRDVCDVIMSGCESWYDPEIEDEVYKDIHEVATILKCNKEVRIALRNMPSAQQEWNNHTVACLLAELFHDTCACNYNSIDEWLPEKCELLDSCPNPGGVACWEQFLKHKAERRTDE